MATRPAHMSESSRKTVASYASYGEAERAVDHLADRGFPVSRVSIVGQGIHFVEQIKGPWGYTGAAVQGMLSGAAIGALFGLVLGVFSLVEPLVSGIALALYGLLFGGLIGLVVGPIGHSMWRGRRDFRSVGSIEASTFDIVVDAEVGEDARRILAKDLRSVW